MTNKPTAEQIWLNEEQLAALVAPKTLEVFRAFRAHGPAAVEEIQKVLGTPSKTIYYQVRKLVKVGLLGEAGSSKGSRRDRQVYEAVHGSLRMPDGFQGARYERLAARGVTATLRLMIRNFNEAAARAETRPELVDDLFINTYTMRLNGGEVKEFKRRIREVCDEFGAKSSPDGSMVSVAAVMTPHESRLRR